MFYTLYMEDARKKMKKERLKRLVKWGYVTQEQAKAMYIEYCLFLKRYYH